MAKLPRLPVSAQGGEKALLAVFPGARAGLTSSGKVGLRTYDNKRVVPVDQLLKDLKVKRLATSPGPDLENIKGAILELQQLKKMEASLRKLPPREGQRLATSTEAAKLQAAKSFVDTGSKHFTKLGMEDLTPADRRSITAALDMMTRQREAQRGKGVMPGEIPEGTRRRTLSKFESQALAKGAGEKKDKKRRLIKGTQKVQATIRKGLSEEDKAAIKKGASQARLSAVFPVEAKDVVSKEAREVTRLRESVGGSGAPKSKQFGESAIAGARDPKMADFSSMREDIISNINDVPTAKVAKSVRDYYAKVDKALEAKKITREVATSLKNRMVEDLMRSGVMDKVGAADAILGRLAGGGTLAQDVEGKIIRRMDLPGPYPEEVQGRTPRLPVEGPAPRRPSGRSMVAEGERKFVGPRQVKKPVRQVDLNIDELIDRLREGSAKGFEFDLESGSRPALFAFSGGAKPKKSVGRYERNRLTVPANKPLEDDDVIRLLRILLQKPVAKSAPAAVASTGSRTKLRQVANPVELVASLSRPNALNRPSDPETLRRFFALREKALLGR